MALSVKEICQAITDDFKRRGYTHKAAAEMIGTTPQNMSNMLSARRPFSRKMAQKLSSSFGYNIDWLLFGNGEMYAPGRGFIFANAGETPYYYGNFEPVMMESRKLRAAERLLQILNNKVAISAFHAIIEGKSDEFEELLGILEDDYGYNTPFILNNPKANIALRKMREFYEKAETEAAKVLVTIEQKAAAGEVIAVDAEVERFKKKLQLIADIYK